MYRKRGVPRGRWRLKAAWTCRRKSGGEEEENDEDDDDDVSGFTIGRTRFFDSGAGGTGRLASLSMAWSQRHFRSEEKDSLGSKIEEIMAGSDLIGGE